jgi:hypothetical protein
VSAFKSTWCCNQEDRHLHLHCCENLKSQTTFNSTEECCLIDIVDLRSVIVSKVNYKVVLAASYKQQLMNHQSVFLW